MFVLFMSLEGCYKGKARIVVAAQIGCIPPASSSLISGVLPPRPPLNQLQPHRLFCGHMSRRSYSCLFAPEPSPMLLSGVKVGWGEAANPTNSFPFVVTRLEVGARLLPHLADGKRPLHCKPTLILLLTKLIWGFKIPINPLFTTVLN